MKNLYWPTVKPVPRMQAETSSRIPPEYSVLTDPLYVARNCLGEVG